MTNKFEAGLFYGHDNSEYELERATETALYCLEIRNANEGTEGAKPYFEAVLIGLDGSGINIEVEADGTPKNGGKFYRPMTSGEFAEKLLERFIAEETRKSELAKIKKEAAKAEEALNGVSFFD